MGKFQDTGKRMLAVLALKTLSTVMPLKDISEALNIPVPVLSRYVNGHILPKTDRAEEILTLFNTKYLVKMVKNKIRRADGVIDNSLLLADVPLLNHIAIDAVVKFGYLNITKVLTKEADGIPLATLISQVLGTQLIVAKRRKEPGIPSFYEVKQTYSSGLYSYIYVPRGLLRRGDNVLVVDDIVRTGSTIEALVRAVRAAKAVPVGIYSIIGVRRAVEKLAREYNFPVKVLVLI